MSKDNVVALSSPENVEDPLTELLHNGAKRLIHQAIEAELAEMLAKYEGQMDEQGRRMVVRNGYLSERDILTSVGPVTVKMPKVRSRGEAQVVFRSSLVPPKLAVGDGALGFWSALDEVYPKTRHQRC